MALKQSIVVVNEYTVKNASGKGSRGSSPGNYVTEYMSRDRASETLTPVKRTDQEDFVTRYMARESAVDRLDDRMKVKPEFKSIQRYGGVAFGYGSVSLSDQKLVEASKDIQANFDKGKTVLKTVLSFDEEYLRENHIIPDTFVCKKRGDYRGNIDQMKLRLGIMQGLEKLSKDFDDLQYIGVIQVDTMHVHCHLAMVDRGRGQLMPDGTQRGKLSSAQKNMIRRGIDLYLDETKEIQHMSSNVNMDKRNTAMFIKRVSHKTMQQNGVAQLLLACLPSDKRLWRASTNSKSMEKANGLTREYVRELFAEPDSGYDKVQRSIYNYAEARRNKEALTGEEFRKLIKNGEQRVEDECVNSVYSMLQSIEKQDLTTHTPMLDMMAVPMESISKQADEFGEFTYRLRSYSTRLSYHKKEREKAHNIVKEYEDAQIKGNVSDASHVVYDFFKFEEDYNEKLMCKYQHFLHFLPPSGKYDKELNQLLDYKQRVSDVNGMLTDRSIRRMTTKNAEEYGERVYNQRGGHFMPVSPDVIETRLAVMQSRLEDLDKDFAYKIATDGLSLDINEDRPSFKKHIKHDFKDVKALDLHHLSYDFPTDMNVSQHNIDTFVEIAARRAQLAAAARQYFIDTEQEEELDNFNMRDIRLMQRTANNLQVKPQIESKRADENIVKPVHTTNLGQRFDLSIPVKQSLREIEMQDEMDEDYSIVGRRKRRR